MSGGAVPAGGVGRPPSAHVEAAAGVVPTFCYNEVLSSFQVAKVLGVHPSTVGQWVLHRGLTCYRTAGGHRRFVVADLVLFCQVNYMPLRFAVRPAI